MHPSQRQEPPMDAIKLLKTDHKLVKELLAQLEETSERATKKRASLLREIQINLKAHTTIEEEIFYPAFKKAGQKAEAKMYFEALEEHRAAEDLVLPDLLGTDPSSVEFSGRAKVLKELIEHHADEEEKEMFKDAKELLSKEELVELGSQMEARKEEVIASFG
jgi:hemerythrin-like domain-containing protein